MSSKQSELSKMGKGKAGRKLSPCDIFLITGIVLGGISILVIGGLSYKGIIGHKNPHNEHICQVEDIFVKHVRCEECIYDLAGDHHSSDIIENDPQPEEHDNFQDDDMSHQHEEDKDYPSPPELGKDHLPPPEDEKGHRPPPEDEKDHTSLSEENSDEMEEEKEWWMNMLDDNDRSDNWRNRVENECPTVPALLVKVSYKVKGRAHEGILHEDLASKDTYPMHSFVDCAWKSSSSSDYDEDFSDSKWENDFPHEEPSWGHRRDKRQAGEDTDETDEGRRGWHHRGSHSRRPGHHDDHDRSEDDQQHMSENSERTKDEENVDHAEDPYHKIFDDLPSEDLRAMAQEFLMMQSQDAGFPCYSHPDDPQHLMYEAPFWRTRRCKYLSWPVCITAGLLLGLIIKKIVECAKKPKRIGSTVDIKKTEKGESYIVPEVVAVPNDPEKEIRSEKDPSILGPEVVPSVTLNVDKTTMMTGLSAGSGVLDKETEALGLTPETPRNMVDAPYPPVSEEMPRIDSPPPAYSNLPKY